MPLPSENPYNPDTGIKAEVIAMVNKWVKILEDLDVTKLPFALDETYVNPQLNVNKVRTIIVKHAQKLIKDLNSFLSETEISDGHLQQMLNEELLTSIFPNFYASLTPDLQADPKLRSFGLALNLSIIYIEKILSTSNNTYTRDQIIEILKAYAEYCTHPGAAGSLQLLQTVKQYTSSYKDFKNILNFISYTATWLTNISVTTLNGVNGDLYNNIFSFPGQLVFLLSSFEDFDTAIQYYARRAGKQES